MIVLDTLIGKYAPLLGSMKQFLLDRRAILASIKAQYPKEWTTKVDLEIAAIDEKIKVLDGTLSPVDLAALGKTILDELAALPSTGLKPTPKAGAVTGG